MAITELGGSANVMAQALLGTAQANAQARLEAARIGVSDRNSRDAMQLRREELASGERIAGQELAGRQSMAELALRGQLAIGQQQAESEMAVTKLREMAASQRQTEGLDVQSRNAQEDRAYMQAIEQLKVNAAKEAQNSQQAFQLQTMDKGQASWMDRMTHLDTMYAKRARTNFVYQLGMLYPQLRLAASALGGQANLTAATADSQQRMNQAKGLVQAAESQATGKTLTSIQNVWDNTYFHNSVFAEGGDFKVGGPGSGTNLDPKNEQAWRDAPEKYKSVYQLWRYLPSDLAPKAADVLMGGDPSKLPEDERRALVGAMHAAVNTVKAMNVAGDERGKAIQNFLLADVGSKATEISSRLGWGRTLLRVEDAYAVPATLSNVMQQTGGDMKQVVQMIGQMLGSGLKEQGVDSMFRDLMGSVLPPEPARQDVTGTYGNFQPAP